MFEWCSLYAFLQWAPALMGVSPSGCLHFIFSVLLNSLIEWIPLQVYNKHESDYPHFEDYNVQQTVCYKIKQCALKSLTTQVSL